MPRGNSKEKRLARERQVATGKPYTECLAEIRAEYLAQQEVQAADDEDDPTVQRLHIQPEPDAAATPCWLQPRCPWPLACDEPVVCAARAAGDYGVDRALDH
ncbi:hypothetical protein ABT215_12995 [Streptomyces sp900105755]|uniref:hypothetical protein n=1 Tax=Streptomyces sp. 900105755 TaxID=3154389 RepID=UPI0033186511